MREREIPSTEWRSFGESFTGEHHGWITAAVHRESTGIEHRLWEDAALEHLELGANGNGYVLTITAATPDARYEPGARLKATADGLRRVWVLETDDGRHAGLRVEDGVGGATELRFRVSVSPDIVDGVMGDEN